MASLPDAWVEDARNLDNAEQLLHSAHGILLETPAIGDFLRNETNKRIVVAPKGYGKTFLLKSKRILLQRNSENLLCLPDNQLVDATISDSPSLSQADVQRFIDYAFWCQIWSAALMVSVVKSSAKFHPLDPADFRSPVMRQLLLSSYPVSPFDALKRLINSEREFQQARRSHLVPRPELDAGHALASADLGAQLARRARQRVGRRVRIEVAVARHVNGAV